MSEAIRISGLTKSQSFSSSSISGPVSLSVEEAPKALDIQTTSGNIDLVLPEDAAFTLDCDSTSGELSSDLPYTMESVKAGDRQFMQIMLTLVISCKRMVSLIQVNYCEFEADFR